MEVLSRPYITASPEQATRLTIGGESHTINGKTSSQVLTLGCTTHLSQDNLLTMDIDLTNGTQVERTRIAVKNGETIALTGRSPATSGVGGMPLLLFLTPHVAMSAEELAPQRAGAMSPPSSLQNPSSFSVPLRK
jgi:hypothetical protein